MTDAYAAELAAARAIALDAATLVRSFMHGGRPLHVDSKPGDEPVTEADHAANRLIVARLAASFPGDVILSEELPDDGSRHGADRVWMVDPIDGTRDFIRGDTGFAVMIGLCVGGRPIVGVVAQPATGKTYGGVVGGGAWIEIDAAHAGGAPGATAAPDTAVGAIAGAAQVDARHPLHTSSLAQPPGIRLVASKSHRTPRVDAVRQALAIEDEVNIGSVGLKIGLVAEAARDLYVYTGGRTKLWDTCGPEAILSAAGGRVTDMDGRPLDYTARDLYNRRGIVASNGPLHDFVVRTLAPLLANELAD